MPYHRRGRDRYLLCPPISQFLSQVRTQQEGHCQQGKDLSPGSESAGTLKLDFSASRARRNNFLCLIHPACGILLWQLKLDNTACHSVLSQRTFSGSQGPDYTIWPRDTHLNLSFRRSLFWPFCSSTWRFGFSSQWTRFPQTSSWLFPCLLQVSVHTFQGRLSPTTFLKIATPLAAFPASALSCFIFLHFSIWYMYLIHATYILTRNLNILVVIAPHKNGSSMSFCLSHTFLWELSEVPVEWTNELEKLQVYWRGNCLVGDEAGGMGCSWTGRQGVGRAGPYRPSTRDFGIYPKDIQVF